MKSVMQHQFSRVPSVEIPRSSFDRSCGYKTTFNNGDLIPFFLDEALPGDTFNCRVTALARVATLLSPVMDNMYLDTFFFAVPYRLVWNNWKKFHGEQDDPGDSISFVPPTLTTTAVTGEAVGTIFDYMGIPTEIPDLEFNSFHLRAYNLIYNEWFRDENLQDSVTVHKDDGATEALTDYSLLKRGKRRDYFTSCLPWPQKGDSVSLPLGTTAPVTGIGKLDQTYGQSPANVYETGGTASTSYAAGATYFGDNIATPNQVVYLEEDPNNAGYPGIYADLASATAATINQIRQAFQVQRLLERDARGGTRYVELIASHFGIKNAGGDARLQRPEYLGGGSTPLNVSEVTSTNKHTLAALGDLGAKGSAFIRNHGFTKSFTEHCLIVGLISARADLTYQQGLNRMWSRQTRYDYFYPSLSHLGEQAVLNKEIYAQGTSDDELVFGYNERYAEYRYKPSLITGEFRSAYTATLDSWHLSQEFGSLPTLGDTFIKEDVPMDRVKAAGSTVPDFIFDSYINLKCARPMPLYGVPGLLDHF